MFTLNNLEDKNNLEVVLVLFVNLFKDFVNNKQFLCIFYENFKNNYDLF